ncbi:MAG: GlsB/YeaQ/YmgE family stress response membrane protein [Lachnospiraceae bacterium]|nr:GlsB/YeaQ/YmgE family stress response membrane protein [Lachnospiraceae bacterium]
MGPFLTWVIKILIYAVCGAVAGALMGNKKGGWLRNIIVGFLGAVVGGFLAALLPIPGAGNWIVSIIISIGGACLVLWLCKKFF